MHCGFVVHEEVNEDGKNPVLCKKREWVNSEIKMSH